MIVKEGLAYDRYLRAYRLLQKRDKELGRAFDDFRRSAALTQLALMRRMGLLTDEDLAGFSEALVRRGEAERRGMTRHSCG